MERDGVRHVLNGDGDVHHNLHCDDGIVGQIAVFDARRPLISQLFPIQGAQESLWDYIDTGPGVNHGFQQSATDSDLGFVAVHQWGASVVLV